MTGRIGAIGTAAEHWYYAGRDHLFIAVEDDIHRGNLNAIALPPLPPALRDKLYGERDLKPARVALLPDTVADAATTPR
jgi:hypothetical protein